MYKVSYFLLAFLFLTSSCVLVGTSDKGLIVYHGFDFSSGYLNTDITKNDIIAIADRNPSIEGSLIDGNLYFITSAENLKQDIKDLGEASFNSIDRISPDFLFDSISTPVLVGNLYIIKCKDGFAKVRVLSYSGESLFKIQINVLYEFTSDSVF